MLRFEARLDANEEMRHMVTLDCPWCDGPMALEAGADDVACDGCSVRVELAPDPLPATIARAA